MILTFAFLATEKEILFCCKRREREKVRFCNDLLFDEGIRGRSRISIYFSSREEY